MPFLAPLGVALGGAVTGVATWLGSTALGSTLLQLGLGLAASVLRAKLQPKQKAQASQLETQYGEDLARWVIVGTCATAGQHIYRNAYGKGNRRIQDVYVLSHFLITDVPRVRFKGEWRALELENEDRDLGFPVDGSSGKVYVKIYHGTLDQQADPNLIEEANPSDRWTADHRLAGVAYAVVTSLLHREKLTAPAELLFEVQGAPLYDWRHDDTAGGEGAHRWADQSTWEYSDNPAQQAYCAERGFTRGTELIVGKGVRPARLPLAEWTLAANICDETVDGAKRYRASAILSAGDGATHASNMEPLLEAFAASWYEGPAGEFPIAGAKQAVVATFTDADLYAEKDRRFSRYRPRDQLINFVAGTFPDPDAFYETKPFTAKTDAALVAQDGERKAVSIPFEAVPFPECVDRLADIALRANRYQASADVCVHPKLLWVRVGQWVRWDSARHGNRVFQVKSRQLGPIGPDAPRAVYWSLEEVGDGIFDPTQFTTVPVIPAGPGTPDYQSELDNAAAFPVTLEFDSGAKRPAIRATWSEITDVTITGGKFEYWPLGQQNARQSEPFAADQEALNLAKGVISEQAYVVRYRLESRPQRTFAWVTLPNVTTPKALLGPADFFDNVIGYDQLDDELKILEDWIDDDLAGQVQAQAQDLADQAQAMATEATTRAGAVAADATARANAVLAEANARLDETAALGDRFRTTADSLSAIALLIAEADFSAYTKIKQLRTEIEVRDAATKASYTEAITVALTGDSSIATRLITLEALSGSNAAAISQEITARATAVDAIAQQVTLLSVGSDQQFDWAKLWKFNTDVEGWGGNGAPTVSAGYLRPANHATDPYVTSASGLAINGTEYAQVRFRVKRTGTPTWEGYVWWQTPTATTWDTARRATVAAPTFDANGFANVTVQMPWAGSTIHAIRIDATTAQAVGSQIELDWIAIGAPSPGASAAALLEETTVRTAQNSAMASTVTQLTASVNATSTTLSGQVAALSSLTGDVSALNGTVTSHTSQLTALTASVGNKADATAVSSLDAQVQALGGDNILSQAEAVVALRGQVDAVGLLVADLDFARARDKGEALKATATATQQLSQSIEIVDGKADLNAKAITQVQAALPGLATANALQALTARVTTTENSVTSQAEAITQVQSALPGKASASAVSSLTTRVTTTEGNIESVSSAVTSVQNALPGKAAASAVTALTTRVTNAEETISSQSDAITTINNALPGKASVTAVQGLTTRISDAEGTITSQGSAITSIQNALPGKASASALTALTTRVTDAEGTITSQGNALTALNNTVGDVSAGARFRMQSVASPGGGWSRIGMQARVSTAASYATAALFLDAKSNGDSRIVLAADAVWITDGDAETKPFVFSGGVARLALANIGTVTAGLLRSPDNKFRIDLSAGSIEWYD